MKRYFFYIVFINSIANTIIFLPRILLPNRYEGAIMAIIFSIPLGTLLLYFFSKPMMKFPRKIFSEILELAFSRPVQIIIVLLYCPAWYFSGALMLSATLEITNRFIDPHTSEYLILAAFVALIIFAIRTEGATVLYVLEIFMLFIVPMILFIYIKAIINPFFSWDACRETVTHSLTFPQLTSFAATSYVFTGYTDMIIFNRAFKGKFELKYLWLFPVFELVLLLFAFFIPIGFLGTQEIVSLNFPWITSSDCISIKTGVIERTLFIYLLVYLITSIINIIVHWYVSFELFRGLFQTQFKFKKMKIVNWFILGVFAVVPFIYISFISEETDLVIRDMWLIIRLFLEICLVILLNFIAYKAKKKGVI